MSVTCTSNHNTHGAIGDRCASDRVGDEGQTRVVAKGQCAAHPHQTETDGRDASLLGRPFEPRTGEDSNKRQSDTGSRSQQEMDRRRRQDRPIAARIRLSPTRSSRTTRTEARRRFLSSSRIDQSVVLPLQQSTEAIRSLDLTD